MMKKPTKTEVAAAVLSLAAKPDPVKELLGNAQDAKNALGDATDDLVAQAYKDVHDAGEDAFEHVLLVVKNNPKSSIHDILARPDVKQALSKPFLGVADTVQGLVKEAWSEGWEAGTTQGKADLDTWGLEPLSEPLDESSGVLDSLLGDVAHNASGAQQRLSEAMVSANKGDVASALTKVLDDLSRRMAMSVDVARSRAATDAQIAIYRTVGTGIRLVWVTHFRPTTCATCARLHGRSIGLGETFDTQATFHGKPPAPYVDLAGPPRHPNCGCKIIAVAGKTGATTPGTMQKWASSWWAKQTGTGDE